MSGRISLKEFPWYCDYTQEDVENWFKQDEVGVREWYEENMRMWNEVQQGLPPGYPNFLSFEAGKSDPDYVGQVNAYHVEQAQERVAQRHVQLPTIDVDFAMLSSPHKADRTKAKWYLELRDHIEKERKEGVRAEANGDLKRAQDAKERLFGWIREIEKKRKDEPYEAEVEQNEQLLDKTNRELEWAKDNLTPEQLKANLPHYQSLIEQRNRESNEEESFVIDSRTEKLKIEKVSHPGRTASYLSQIPLGEKTISYELAGIPPLTEEEESGEETKLEPEGPWGTTQQDFEAWRSTGKKAEVEEETPSYSQEEFEESLKQV